MRPLVRVAVVAAAATLAGATALWATSPPPADAPTELAAPTASAPASPPPQPETPPSVAASPRPTSTIAASDAAPRPPAERVVPEVLVIPALDAELSVTPMGLDPDGAMDLPASPSEAGWYQFGPAPGDGAGATVLAAHVDSPKEGRGPLAGLVRLSPGDSIEVRTPAAVHRYVVTDVLRIDKGELDPAAVFSREGEERLHVVSCGGRFDRAAGHYDDNVIAVAVPADGS